MVLGWCQTNLLLAVVKFSFLPSELSKEEAYLAVTVVKCTSTST